FYLFPQQVQQNCMVQRVKVFRQVEDYSPRISLLNILFYPVNGVFCSPPRAVAKAILREHRLINWHELLEHCLLDNTVYDGGNSKLTLPSVRLRDFFSPDWGRSVFPSPYPLCQFTVVFLQPWH